MHWEKKSQKTTLAEVFFTEGVKTNNNQNRKKLFYTNSNIKLHGHIFSENEKSHRTLG